MFACIDHVGVDFRMICCEAGPNKHPVSSDGARHIACSDLHTTYFLSSTVKYYCANCLTFYYIFHFTTYFWKLV